MADRLARLEQLCLCTHPRGIHASRRHSQRCLECDCPMFMRKRWWRRWKRWNWW